MAKLVLGGQTLLLVLFIQLVRLVVGWHVVVTLVSLVISRIASLINLVVGSTGSWNINADSVVISEILILQASRLLLVVSAWQWTLRFHSLVAVRLCSQRSDVLRFVAHLANSVGSALVELVVVLELLDIHCWCNFSIRPEVGVCHRHEATVHTRLCILSSLLQVGNRRVHVVIDCLHLR